MKSLQDEIDSIIDSLKQQRDELRLQLQLGRNEVRSEWEEAERKLDKIIGKADAVRREMEVASEDVLAAIKLSAEEIKRGYNRIRKVL
jgi:hypothetical protein